MSTVPRGEFLIGKKWVHLLQELVTGTIYYLDAERTQQIVSLLPNGKVRTTDLFNVVVSPVLPQSVLAAHRAARIK